MTNEADKPPLKVFYNSACPVCNAGITMQKREMAECEVDWKDIHTDTQAVCAINQEQEFVRERLHVQDESGQVHVGWEAFIALWSHSPKEQWKAQLGALPGIRTLCNLGYNLFANLLYRWNRWRKHW